MVVRPDGVLLTAYHGIKGAREVQIRLKNGEVFDHATLIGADERRDIACLKIAATKLAYLESGTADSTRPGDVAYAVTNSGGLEWSATQGIFSALRMADEVPGAGQGYRVLQFTAPVSSGASGGPLVDGKGLLVGIITRGNPAAAFAVPIESVAGLADGTLNVQLGSGSELQLPTPQTAPASHVVAHANPQEILRNAKTAAIASRTSFFTPETLERELAKQTGYSALGLILVKDRRVADILITVDRPLFTYTFTYTVTDLKTSVVLDTGKVTAIDGNTAAGKIAKDLVARWVKLRQPPGQKRD